MADDLTGALETAAEFAGAGPVRVILASDASAHGVRGPLAIVTDNRDRPDRDARQAVAAQAARLLAGGAPVFVKIDSVLRGAPAVEIAAAIAALRPERIVLAPAFPMQGRITRGGRQRVREPDGSGWRELGPPLADLAPAGVGAVSVWAAGTISEGCFAPGFHVCDAESEADLEAIAHAATDRSTLFVGAAGLAAALAGPGAPVFGAPKEPPLFLFGTSHPVTRKQIDRLAASGLAAIVAPDEPMRMARAVTVALAAGRPAVLDLSRSVAEGCQAATASAGVAAALRGMAPALPRPGHLVAGGGATLAALLTVMGARGLDALGRVEPGVPRSLVVGGAWDGVAVTSKSGGFGAPDLLARLAADGG